MPTDKCCGTCKWWKKQVTMLGRTHGKCQFDISSILPCGISVIEEEIIATRHDDGSDCPCYERKGEDERRD